MLRLFDACFCRIDEDIFAILYSDKASRPNIPVNVLVGLEILKSGFGWSDAELEDALHFNLQVRYALGYYGLDEGHFELRTVYNFRQRLARHMQETGENLLDEVFEQITDAQIERLWLKTGKLRMDSTQIGSNIGQMSRLQLLVEVIQRAWRMLSEEATVRSVKHPFGNGKLPVRGKGRVSMMLIASAAMTNVRRIWRYQRAKNEVEGSQTMGEYAQKQAGHFCFSAYLRSFFCFQVPPATYLSAVA